MSVVFLRPTMIGVLAGATLLGTIATLPAVAQASPSPATAGRATIAGSLPSWAQASARAGAVDPGSERTVEIALTPRDPAQARALATAVSTPGSNEYRHPISAAAYDARFGPTQASVDTVTQWLHSEGLAVTSVSSGHQLVSARGQVGRIEAAFGVQLSTFHATVSGTHRTLVAPDSAITVPNSYDGNPLGGQVQAVLGLDDSDLTFTQQNHPEAPAAATPNATNSSTQCAPYWDATNNTAVPQAFPTGMQSNELCGYQTPAVRSLYGLPASDTGAGVTVAVVGAYDDPALVSDVNRAAHDFGSPQLTSGQYTAILPNSFNPDPGCNVTDWYDEQDLDVEAVHTIAPAAKIRYYAADDCGDTVSAFVQAVSDDQASVITNSWDYAGESSVPADARTAVENAAVEAAIQGQTVLFCSGDFGDNSTRPGSSGISVDFPASDPWVTAVGGTSVGLDANGHTDVLTGWANTGAVQSGNAWTQLPPSQGGVAGASGGGISTWYPTPSYQSALPASATSGHRAVPDIAGLADGYTGMALGYTTASGGYVEGPYGGTSLSTPLTAGLAADAGQIVGTGGWLGFINPAIYQLGANAITDVLSEHAGVWLNAQPITGTPGSFLAELGSDPQSLHDGPGWDDETGVGQPNAGFVPALAGAATG